MTEIIIEMMEDPWLWIGRALIGVILSLIGALAFYLIALIFAFIFGTIKAMSDL